MVSQTTGVFLKSGDIMLIYLFTGWRCPWWDYVAWPMFLDFTDTLHTYSFSFDHSADRHLRAWLSINKGKERPVVSIHVFSCFIQVRCWLSCRGKHWVFYQLFFCNPHVLSNENRLRGKGNGYLAHDSALMTLEGEYQQIWLMIILILMTVILQLSQTTCNWSGNSTRFDFS